jgi:hypothetical protein
MRTLNEGAGFDPGCVKTLCGITAPGILGSTVMRRAKKAKICLLLGITTKSDFVFAQPRPKADIATQMRGAIPGRQSPRLDRVI